MYTRERCNQAMLHNSNPTRTLARLRPQSRAQSYLVFREILFAFSLLLFPFHYLLLLIISLLFPSLYLRLHSVFSFLFHSLLARILTRSLLSRNSHTLRLSLRDCAAQDLFSLPYLFYWS